MRKSLLMFFLGVITTACFSAIALYGNNENWKQEAYQHCAGVYRFNAFNSKIRFQWLDDYYTEELTKALAAPTPSRKQIASGKWERL